MRFRMEFRFRQINHIVSRSCPFHAGLGGEVDGAFAADIIEVIVEEFLGGAHAGAMQQLEEIEVGFHLAGSGETRAEGAEIDAVDIEPAVLLLAGAARQPAVVDQLIDEIHRAQFRDQCRVESDFIQTVDDLAGGFRRGDTRHRIDLNYQNVFGFRRVQEREDRGIAHIAAVPIGHAVDFDRAEHEWQCSGRHHHFCGDLFIRKNAQPSGVHIGRRDIEREIGVVADGVEIDEASDQIAQRINVERIEFVGREVMRHRLEPVLDRRGCKRHQRKHPVGHGALDWRQIAAGARRAPECRQSFAGFFRAAPGEAVRDHDGVQGAGGGTGNSGDLQPPIGQNVIQHAPGKRAVRSAALKRQVDLFRRARLARAGKIPGRQVVEVGFESGRHQLLLSGLMQLRSSFRLPSSFVC